MGFMVFPVPDNYSRDDFIRICEQIAKMGERDHEHLKIVQNAATHQLELRAVAKPRGCARIWSWFYKPAESRFANVCTFAIAFFNRYQKEYQNTCPIASQAILCLKNRWSHKPCSEVLQKLYSYTPLHAIQALNEQARNNSRLAEENHRKAEAMRKQAEQKLEQMQLEHRRKVDKLFQGIEEDATEACQEATQDAATIRSKAAQTLTLPATTDVEMAMRKKLNDKATMDCHIYCKGKEVVKAHWDRLREIHYFHVTDNPRFKKMEDQEKTQGSLEPEHKENNAQAPCKRFDLELEFDAKSEAASVVEGFSAETVLSMIQFLYLGKVDAFEMNKWIELIRLANFVRFDRLTAYCFKHLTECLKKNPTALFAVLSSIPRHHPATKFLTEKFIEISRYRVWFDVPQQRQTLLFLTFQERAKDKSDLSAITALGYCLQYGEGNEIDLKLAEANFQIAVDEGYAPAQSRLASLIMDRLDNRLLDTPKDRARAYALSKASADQRWWAPGFSVLGYCYEKGYGVPQNDSEAARLYTIAAEMGYARAQVNLSYLHSAGLGVLQPSLEKRRELLERAALQGECAALTNLGLAYYHGNVVRKDRNKTFEYFRAAAKQGEVNALAGLGLLYKEGEVVPQDLQKRFKLYCRAVESDPSAKDALHGLGLCFELGEGVAVNRDEAIRYYRRAAACGHANAVRELQRLGVPVGG